MALNVQLIIILQFILAINIEFKLIIKRLLYKLQLRVEEKYISKIS